jgi:hypothetical protein
MHVAACVLSLRRAAKSAGQERVQTVFVRFHVDVCVDASRHELTSAYVKGWRNTMKTFALAGALALVGGLSFAAPAFAGYYDSYGVYHETPLVKDYNYGYDRYDSDLSMSRSDIRASLENQGYENIRDLHRVGNDWTAVAYMDGDWVRITVDGGSGDVIDTDQI